MTACSFVARPALGALLGLTACASTPHITAYQEAPFEPAPRSVVLATEPAEALPLSIPREEIIRGLARAGFVAEGEATPRYSFTIAAAAGSAKAGSFIPGGEANTPPHWVARPDHSLRARIAGGRVTRVTMILMDVVADREVWRGTGTARGKDAEADAKALAGDILAKLPQR